MGGAPVADARTAGLALNGIGAFASRSAVAQAVYTADGASLAMEGWRWPPARLLGLGARSH